MTQETQAPVASQEIGANNPPIKDRLAVDYQSLKDRATELLAGAGRAPTQIKDDDEQGKVGDLVKMLAAAIKRSEGARSNEKEPHLQAGREVDAFFKQISDPLDMAKRGLESRVGVYLRAKADAERKRREDEARARQAEADRLAEQARIAAEKNRPKVAEKKLERAVQAETAATAAAESALAKPADMARTRGDMGSVSTLKQTWTFEIEDEGAIDLEALRPFLAKIDIEKAIRSFVRVHKGAKALAGVRIFEETSAVVR
jgi:hypothetical protein